MSPKHAFPRLLAATALGLTLALAGCGAAPQEDAGTEPTPQETPDASTDDIALSPTLEAAQERAAELVATGDTSAAADFADLPIAESDLGGTIAADDIPTTTDDQAKAAGPQALTLDAVRITLPEGWVYLNGGGIWALSSPDYSVAGTVQDLQKERGTSYDIVAITESMPASAAQKGYAVEIIDEQSRYSQAGTLCSHAVLFTLSDGTNTYVEYAQMIDGADTVAYLMLEATPESYVAHQTEIEALTSSISYLPGKGV